MRHVCRDGWVHCAAALAKAGYRLAHGFLAWLPEVFGSLALRRCSTVVDVREQHEPVYRGSNRLEVVRESSCDGAASDAAGDDVLR